MKKNPFKTGDIISFIEDNHEDTRIIPSSKLLTVTASAGRFICFEGSDWTWNYVAFKLVSGKDVIESNQAYILARPL